MAALKDRLRIPSAMRSCHTAVIGDYVIEGHVPADDIHHLLDVRPEALGLAAPGMAMGDRRDRYQIWRIGRDGQCVFARHPRKKA